MSSMIRSAARTARSGSSSCASGTPKTPTTASPMNFSITPPWDSMRARQICWYSRSRREISSASKRSPSAVDPTRSQNRAVMTLRSSRTGVVSSLVPQSPQNRLSSGFSRAAGRADRHRAASLRRVREPAQGDAKLRRPRWPTKSVMASACDQRKRWALRGSNPRPSPCKGEMNLQVRALDR